VITITITLDAAEAEVIVHVLEERLRGMFHEAMKSSDGRDQMFEVMRPYVHVKDALDDAREASAAERLAPGGIPTGFGGPPPPRAMPPVPQAMPSPPIAGYCPRCGGTANNHRVAGCTG
jgi:hypothetical protein